jgi:hypothetical protein
MAAPAPPQSAPKAKRKPVKLTAVGIVLLGMYTLFVWVVLVVFKKHGSDENVGRFGAFRLKKTDDGKGAPKSGYDGSISAGNVQNGQEAETKKDANSEKSIIKKQSALDGSEIQKLITGYLIKNLDIDSISIERPQPVGENEKEGLGDIRPTMDVIKSALSGAKFGDRVYDTETSTERTGGRQENMPQLTAYCEPVNQTDWVTKPLPVREKNKLLKVTYPHVNSCMALPSQWPVDNPPVDLDPFLPWIHDVFPTPDGKNVMFVAQNRRRCYNGQKIFRNENQLPEGVVGHKGYVHVDPGKNYFMRPQAALFQHVPVKQVGEEDGEPRFRLASHEDADEDGMETRFICRFKWYDAATSSTSIVGYSLSAHELDYEYHTFRKGYLRTHSEAGYDNHVIWTSQLLFKCPVPEKYHTMVATGDIVVDDYSNLFVDLIPIRTAPRHTPPREFLQPRYNFKAQLDGLFLPDEVWGKEHVLPKIEDSGRWENIPVCMPSLIQYNVISKGMDLELLRLSNVTMPNKRRTVDVPMKEMGIKIHKVIACTWASATFRTRGNRANVGDGERRLKEWLEFNLMAGFDHIYVVSAHNFFSSDHVYCLSLTEVFSSTFSMTTVVLLQTKTRWQML